MRALSRSGLLAMAVLVLTGCVPAPSSEPGAPEPVDQNSIAYLTSMCGTEGGEPVGTADGFEAEMLMRDRTDGMEITIDVTVERTDGSDDAVLATAPEGLVLDDEGAHAGAVVAVTPLEPVSVDRDGAEISMRIELAACADGAIEGALADGSYELVVAGELQSEDHDGDRPLLWQPDPMPFTVIGGSVDGR